MSAGTVLQIKLCISMTNTMPRQV